MDMPSSTASSSSSSSQMPMSIFFTSSNTPLYSNAWAPATTGQYAGTCIFLIVLATIFRVLFAVRSLQEQRWRRMESTRRAILIAGRNKKNDGGSKQSTSSESSSDEALGIARPGTESKPWRISTDGPRAVIDTVIAGVGYLLMLAVMTANVGYFLSVLGGVFLGSLTIGRYAVASEH